MKNKVEFNAFCTLLCSLSARELIQGVKRPREREHDFKNGICITVKKIITRTLCRRTFAAIVKIASAYFLSLSLTRPDFAAIVCYRKLQCSP